MGGRASRALSALVAGSLAALPGCKSVLEFKPATPAEVRAAVNAPPQADEGGARQVHFTVQGDKPFGEKGYVPPLYSAGYEMYVSELREQCAKPGAKCPLDDPTSRWELGKYASVADGSTILADTVFVGVLGGAIAANVVCVGENQCGNTGKTVVIVVDVTVGALAVIAVVALASAFSHFRGD
jgi:hypothetical protein